MKFSYLSLKHSQSIRAYLARVIVFVVNRLSECFHQEDGIQETSENKIMGEKALLRKDLPMFASLLYPTNKI